MTGPRLRVVYVNIKTLIPSLPPGALLVPRDRKALGSIYTPPKSSESGTTMSDIHFSTETRIQTETHEAGSPPCRAVRERLKQDLGPHI